MKFRKKPIVIDAFEYRSGEQRHELAQDVIEGRVRYPEDGTMLIHTLEGVMCAQSGDWIIRGINGELYPCKPDIFEATYEPVVNDDEWPFMQVSYSEQPLALQPIVLNYVTAPEGDQLEYHRDPA